MMQAMSPQDVAGVQRGIAERPDSIPTLKTISVPTLIIAGDDDSVPLGEAELMRQNIAGSRLQVIPKAGHYAALEKPASSEDLCATSWTAFHGPSIRGWNCDRRHLESRGASLELSRYAGLIPRT